jgi:hypothetical protein
MEILGKIEKELEAFTPKVLEAKARLEKGEKAYLDLVVRGAPIDSLLEAKAQIRSLAETLQTQQQVADTLRNRIRILKEDQATQAIKDKIVARKRLVDKIKASPPACPTCHKSDAVVFADQVHNKSGMVARGDSGEKAIIALVSFRCKKCHTLWKHPINPSEDYPKVKQTKRAHQFFVRDRNGRFVEVASEEEMIDLIEKSH